MPRALAVELRTAFKRFGLHIHEDELVQMYADADADGGSGIDVFEFEDMIFALVEKKCGVKLRGEAADPKAAKAAEQRGAKDPLHAILAGKRAEALFQTHAQRAARRIKEGGEGAGDGAAGPGRAVSSAQSDASDASGGAPEEELNRLFFTNFHGCGAAPELPKVPSAPPCSRVSGRLGQRRVLRRLPGAVLGDWHGAAAAGARRTESQRRAAR